MAERSKILILSDFTFHDPLRDKGPTPVRSPHLVLDFELHAIPQGVSDLTEDDFLLGSGMHPADILREHTTRSTTGIANLHAETKVRRPRRIVDNTTTVQKVARRDLNRDLLVTTV